MATIGTESESHRPPFVRVDRERVDFTRRARETLLLHLPPETLAGGYFLVIDLYSAAVPVHPEGHLGWWACDLDGSAEVRVHIARKAGRFEVTFGRRSGVEGRRWENPDVKDWSREAVVAVHIVLRERRNNAIASDDVLYLYQNGVALQSARQACERLQHDLAAQAATAPRWYCWPPATRAFVLASDIYERDAVGNFAIGLHKFLRTHGVSCRLGATHFDPRLRGAIEPMGGLLDEIREEDLVFFHFSTYDPYMETVAALRARKILCFHNITPGRFFQIYDAERALLCDKAYQQMGLAARFDGWVVNSRLSGEQLARAVPKDALKTDRPSVEIPCVVVPPLINVSRWESVRAETVDMPDPGDMLLHVGRLAPNKKIEDLFALFQEYRRLNPRSSLALVGRECFKGYSNYLQYLLTHKYAAIRSRVHLLRDLSDGQLKTLYSRSSALVMMSEHEGFCVPVLEAMYFRKPVFAYAVPAVCETLGRTGRLFHRKDFPAVASEMDRVLRDGPLCESIVAGQCRRLAELSARADGSALWEAVEKVLFTRENPL